MIGVSVLPLLALLAGTADTLVVGLLADPVTLFPHRATDLVSQAIVVNVTDTLVRQRGEAGRPEAALATTWATPDHRVWTFTLRENVRFHDGAVLDAAAVVANFESLRRVRGFPGSAERLGPLRGSHRPGASQRRPPLHPLPALLRAPEPRHPR